MEKMINKSTDFTADTHRKWVANFLNGKVEELFSIIKEINEICLLSRFHFLSKIDLRDDNWQSHIEELRKRLIYNFSSFTNVVKTILDSTSTVTLERIGRSRLTELARHGSFIYDARNAATHDGNPLITGWCDGYFFIPYNIKRINHQNKLVTTPPPKSDIRTVCLEFSYDFSSILEECFSYFIEDQTLQGTGIDFHEVMEVIKNSNIVSQDSVILIINDKSVSKINTSPTDKETQRHHPIRRITEDLQKIKKYCEDQILLS